MVIELAVLAGGASTRLGYDKASIIWNNQTVLEYVVSVAVQSSHAVVVVGREKPDGWNTPNVRFLMDETAGLGPLGGLMTALRNSTADSVLTLACDTPLLTSSAIDWLLSVANNSGQLISDGVAVRSHGRWEPLFSIYSKANLTKIEAMISKGGRALHKLIEGGTFQVVEAPAFVADQLTNCNTQEEWGALFRESTN